MNRSGLIVLQVLGALTFLAKRLRAFSVEGGIYPAWSFSSATVSVAEAPRGLKTALHRSSGSR
jgi:hypothetical protein